MFLVAMPGPPSSVLAPSRVLATSSFLVTSKARSAPSSILAPFEAMPDPVDLIDPILFGCSLAG